MFAMSKPGKRGSVILRPVNDNNSNGKPPQATNRRRASQIVHDERGNARVEWIDAGYAGVPLERAPLTIQDTPARGDSAKLSVERKRSSGFDPYARVGATQLPEQKKQAGKRDLKKLGEWIKLKRELEARKESGEPETEDEDP